MSKVVSPRNGIKLKQGHRFPFPFQLPTPRASGRQACVRHPTANGHMSRTVREQTAPVQMLPRLGQSQTLRPPGNRRGITEQGKPRGAEPCQHQHPLQTLRISSCVDRCMNTSGREQDVPNSPRHRSKLRGDKGGIPDHWVKTDSLFNQDVGGAPDGTPTLAHGPDCIHYQ